MPKKDPFERMQELIQEEQLLWQSGLKAAGIDEVGRGPLAGPVMAGCTVFLPHQLLAGVDDSKKLSEKKRMALAPRIRQMAEYACVGAVSAQEVDSMGIANATRLAMEKAGRGAGADVYLVDAVKGLALAGEVRSIIRGDLHCYTIAAASIIAKVQRDGYMTELHGKYPQYGFDRNKGYGTAEHIRAIREYGPCPEHRRTFLGGILGKTP